MKLAYFIFLTFAVFSTENEYKKITVLQPQERELSSQRQEQKRQDLKNQKMIGSHLVALQNFLVPQHVNAFKIKVTGKKWQNVFPNESSVKVLRDIETNEMSWDDQKNLIPNVVKAEIERCLQQKGEEMSNCLFDSISYWYFHVAAHPFVKQILFPVSENVDVQRESEGNKTPMMIAAKFDAEKAVAKLIERGATTEAEDQHGRRALQYAAMYGGENSAEILLRNGAKIDAQDEDGTTALMLAAYHGHANLVKVLLKFDADAKMSDNYGEIALNHARRFNRQNCAEVIEEYGAKLNGKIEKI